MIARIARLAAIVAKKLPSWPPKISGNSAGRITNPASSVLPIRSGIARIGRPWATLRTAIPASRMTRPPITASTFRHHVQSRSPAPSISPMNTRPSRGAARLKTSVAAEKSSTNIGSPVRRKRRS